MKNHWLTFFGGTVKVKVEGEGIERFINQLTRSRLPLWDVKREKNHAVSFYIKLQHIHKLRHQARKFDCTVYFVKGQGAPFLKKRAWKNVGFVFGFVLFFAVITLLSNVVWGIKVEGASPQLEHKIKKDLQGMGVSVGKLQWFIEDPETIQRKITNKNASITWVGVETSGTTYKFNVVEKNTPKLAKKIPPRNLVANQKAVISDLFVESGKPEVKVNQYVKKGQVLVSGLIGKEGKYTKVAAIGEVWGKTWYKTNVELPLKTHFEVYTGKEKRKYQLQVGSFHIPIWGFGKVDFSTYNMEQVQHKIKFLKWTLPVHFTDRTYREKEGVTRVYSKKEAVVAAKTLARSDVKSRLLADGKIVDEYVLQDRVENGKVKLALYYQVIENIVQAKPIPKEKNNVKRNNNN